MIDIDDIIYKTRERYDAMKYCGVEADGLSRQVRSLAEVLVKALNEELELLWADIGDE